ncbi:MAG: hypothetical protein COA49_08385 [Bacteroidetes bacterium]|nr:MAG: hypothetical protein COA49_08385 [Bacteroidota bacterium]
MKKRANIYLFVLILILFSTNKSIAQTSSNKRHTLSQSDRSIFDQASILSEEGIYHESSRLWAKLVETYPLCGNYKFYYGVSILYAGEPLSKVESAFANSIFDSGTLITGSGKYNEDLCTAPIDVLVYYAEVKSLLYKFDEALDLLNQFKDKADKYNPIHYKADQLFKSINIAKALMSKPIDVTITNLGEKVNTEYDETHPCIRADEYQMFFTSNRPRSNGSNHGTFDPNSKQHYGDIYVSDRDSSWGDAEWVNLGLSKHKNAISVSPFGSKLFISHVDGWETFSYTANKNKGKWQQAVISNSQYPMLSEGSTVFSPNKDFAVMSIRDVKGNTGYDLYIFHKLSDNSWSEPQIMSEVNSDLDEITPFISADGTLFFSSNGLDGLGGFDCYKTNFIDGQWCTPINLGYPINTVDDDAHIAISADGSRAYISSRRNRPNGDYDLFEISFTPESRIVNNNILLLNLLVLEDVDRVQIKCVETGDVYDAGVVEDGDLYVRSILYGGFTYEVRFSLKGEVIKTDVIEIKSDAGYHSLTDPINSEGGWISGNEILLVEREVITEEVENEEYLNKDSLELTSLLGEKEELDNWVVFYELTPKQIHAEKLDIDEIAIEVIRRIKLGLHPKVFISSSAKESSNRSLSQTHEFSGKRCANIYLRLKALLLEKGYTNKSEYSFLNFDIKESSGLENEIPDFVRIEIK